MGYWISGALCTLAVYAIQLYLFGAGAKSRSAADITSFFAPHEYMKSEQHIFLTCIAPIPLTLAFIGILYFDQTFSEFFNKYFFKYFKFNVWFEEITGIKEALIPRAYFPLIVVVLSMLFFGCHLKAAFRRIESTVLSISGIDMKINELVSSFSSKVMELNKNDYGQVMATIRKHQSIDYVPLAEELADSSNEKKLSFQLLHFTKADISKLGAYASLLNFTSKLFGLKENDVECETTNRKRWIFELICANLIYIIVCILYGFFAPDVRYLLVDLSEFAWPEKEEIGTHFRDVVFCSIAVIAPAIGGMVYFSTHSSSIRKRHEEVKTICMLFAVVFLVSFVLLIVNQTLFTLDLLSGRIEENEASGRAGEREYFAYNEFVYAFVYALVPSLVVLTTAIVGPSGRLSAEKVILGTLIFGAGLLVAQYVYEYISEWSNKYWLHQGLMGTTLGLTSLALAALFLKR